MQGRWKCVALVATLIGLFAQAALAADYQDGTKAKAGQRTAPQLLYVDPADSVRSLAAGRDGKGFVLEQNPTESKMLFDYSVYSDTLSVNGRSRDTTAAMPIEGMSTCGISFRARGFCPGLTGSTGGVTRLGVTIVLSNTATLTDTTTTAVSCFQIGGGYADRDTAAQLDVSAQHIRATCEYPVSFINRPTATVAPPVQAYRSAVISFKNPGYKYAWAIMRVLAETAITSSSGCTGGIYTFRLEASMPRAPR